jgi:hypothetical protein
VARGGAPPLLLRGDIRGIAALVFPTVQQRSTPAPFANIDEHEHWAAWKAQQSADDALHRVRVAPRATKLEEHKIHVGRQRAEHAALEHGLKLGMVGRVTARKFKPQVFFLGDGEHPFH